MRNILSFRTFAILGAAGLAAAAADFNPVMSVVRATWPDRQHIGVVCNYAEAKDQVQQLAQAAGGDAHITVVDTRSPVFGPAAAQILAGRGAHFLMLMPDDRTYGDGRFEGTRVVRRLASHGIPSIGTSPAAIQQGAVFAVGEATHGELLVTDKLHGSISVILPDKVQFGRGFGMASNGSAKVSVVGLP